jgi:hypothetical protein
LPCKLSDKAVSFDEGASEDCPVKFPSSAFKTATTLNIRVAVGSIGSMTETVAVNGHLLHLKHWMI